MRLFQYLKTPERKSAAAERKDTQLYHQNRCWTAWALTGCSPDTHRRLTGDNFQTPEDVSNLHRVWHTGHVFQRFAVVLLVLITASRPWVRGADTNEIVLRNSRVAIKLDRESGGVRSIEDRETGDAHRLQGIGFAVTADRGVATSKQAVGVEASDLAATWRFETELLRINLRYRLGAEDRFVEKWLEITAKNSQP